MADFCYQCTRDILGLGGEENDLSNLARSNNTYACLCEGCGPCIVDIEGKCKAPNCLKQHGKETK